MKLRLSVFTVLALSFGLFYSCGSSGPAQPSNEISNVMDDPFSDLQEIVNNYTEDGVVAALGEGVSSRQDLAKEKAILDANGRLAQAIELKVTDSRRKFVEEVSNNDRAEINELFDSKIKQIAVQAMKGVITKKTKYIEMTDKKVKAGVVQIISPKAFVQSMNDEMKSQPLLYERFRASKAFEELDKEVQAYEAAKNKP